MTVRWRAAVAAAWICLAGSAAAEKPDEEVKAIAPAASAGSDNKVAAAAFEKVHDRTAPRAVEDSAAAIDLSVVYTAEVLRNSRGGQRRAHYLDNLDVTVTVDAERAFGWQGATLFAYGLYNNGEPFSDDLVGAAQGVSNIETGVGAVRLYEAWIEQRFASDRASVKLGLYDLNSEFDAIEAAALFINPSHGIGPDFSQSGRNGPSIFPVTSLALRGDYKLADRWFVRAAILDAVPGNPDRPKRTVLQLDGEGALGVVELNYLDDRTKAAVGYWRYTGRFETFAPTSEAEPAQRRGNDGLYAFVERRLTRERVDDAQGLAGWLRMGFASEKLNPIGRYVSTGLSYTGPFKGRDEDQVGVALGLAEFGAPFRRSSALASNPLNRREVIIEATYRARLTRWLTLQPDVQYVINPGAEPATANALVLGLRAEIGF
jgi:porin